jgi:CrcB protein
MFKLLLIALGGAAGTLARYGTATAFRGVAERAGFPVGTLTINLLGCFLIGLLFAMFTGRVVLRAEYQQMILVGFLGGFTTFSTFGLETFELLRARHYATAGAYVLLSNVVGVALVVLGYRLGER